MSWLEPFVAKGGRSEKTLIACYMLIGTTEIVNILERDTVLVYSIKPGFPN